MIVLEIQTQFITSEPRKCEGAISAAKTGTTAALQPATDVNQVIGLDIKEYLPMPNPSRKRQIKSCHQVVLYPLPIAGPRIKMADMAIGTLRPTNLSDRGSDSQQPLSECQGWVCRNRKDTLTQD
jgi:hypothetical protein